MFPRLLKLVNRFLASPPPAPKVKPRPWEDPARSAADRQAWLDAQPKCLERKP